MTNLNGLRISKAILLFLVHPSRHSNPSKLDCTWSCYQLSIYYSIDEATNRLQVSEQWVQSIVVGRDEVYKFVGNLIVRHLKAKKRTCVLALDGFLGVEWKSIVFGIEDVLKKDGLRLETIDFSSMYKSPDEMTRIVDRCLTIDPSFGFVFKEKMERLLDLDRIEELRKHLEDHKKKLAESLPAGILCYGCGAAIPRLRELCDYIFYVDITREELFNRSLKEPVFPLGSEGTDQPVHKALKRLYYVDFPVLDSHKKYVLRHTDWYVDGNLLEELKLLPRHVYDAILSTLAQYPFRVKPLTIPLHGEEHGSRRSRAFPNRW